MEQTKTQRMLELEEMLGEPLELFLKRLYWDEGKSIVEIGPRLGIVPTSCTNYMERMGIPRRSFSQASIKKWKSRDPEQRKGISKSFKTASEEYWSNPSNRQRRKEQMQAPEIRAKLSAAAKKQWADQSFRLGRSQAVKSFWQVNQGIRLIHKQRTREAMNAEVIKERMAELMRVRWENSEYRERMQGVLICNSHTFWQDPAHRDIWSFQARQLWESERYRSKQRAGYLKSLLAGRMIHRTYTPWLLRRMLDWKGARCSYPYCKVLLSAKSVNKWHACQYHASLVRRAVNAASSRYEAALEKFGLQPSKKGEA